MQITERAHGDEQVERLSRLYVSVVGDVLDRLGFRSQILHHSVRPVSGERLVGRAFPVQAVRNAEVGEAPYEHELAAVDAVPAGGVVVLATGGELGVGIWGELLATRVLARGGAGAVTDGGVRDVTGLQGLGFPTFAASISARDSAGRLRVTAWGEPVVCGGVFIRPGDLVLADLDGVVVVPAQAAEDALAASETKRSREEVAREALERGATVAQVWEEHGVL